MKKRSWVIALCIALLTVLLPAGQVEAQQVEEEEKKKSGKRAIDVARESGYQLDDRYQPAGSIITEIHTGQILWEENKDVSWAPASMTKLMTILLAYDAMEEGKFEKDMQVAVNEKYTDIAGRYALSNNVMQMGATYTVGELIDLIIVPSSAAATYMLADLVEPDPDKFVALMNQKAKEIGMTHTTYYNCVGVTNDLLYPYAPKNLPADADNVTSPQDYALLCSYFVKTYPDILTHTSSPEIVVKEGTPYEEHFKSYQISLEGAKYGLKGTDGLKTGSSGRAGFNYSSTAKRQDTRLVEIVMGVSDWTDQTGEELRHLVGNAIMEQAFEKYEYRKVLPKGTHQIGKEKIVTKKDLWDCVPKEEKIKFKMEDGKVFVDFIKSCRSAGASATDHSSPNFFAEISAVKSSVKERNQSPGSGSEVNGCAKDKAVSIFSFFQEFVNTVIAEATICFFTVATVNTSGNGVIAQPEDFGFYAVLFQSVCDFTQCCICAAFFVWAAVYQYYFHGKSLLIVLCMFLIIARFYGNTISSMKGENAD